MQCNESIFHWEVEEVETLFFFGASTNCLGKNQNFILFLIHITHAFETSGVCFCGVTVSSVVLNLDYRMVTGEGSWNLSCWLSNNSKKG